MLIYPRGIYAPKQPLPDGEYSLFICSSMEDIAEKNVHYGPLSSDKKDILRAVPLSFNIEYPQPRAYVIVAELITYDKVGHIKHPLWIGTRNLEEAQEWFEILLQDSENGTLNFFQTGQGKKMKETDCKDWLDGERAEITGLSPILEWLPDGMWVD